jgi:hypothetical protein
MPIEVEYVHHMLLIEAADIANRMLNEEASTKSPFGDDIGLPPGEAFRPDPLASEKGGLCLTIDPSITIERQPETIRRLHEIGIEAVRQALVKNSKQFVGLIMGDARRRRNYFDRFNPNPQMRLF